MPTSTEPHYQPVLEMTPEQLIAQVYQSAANNCELLVDALPFLRERGVISAINYARADRLLTESADIFRELQAQTTGGQAPPRLR